MVLLIVLLIIEAVCTNVQFGSSSISNSSTALADLPAEFELRYPFNPFKFELQCTRTGILPSVLLAKQKK